MSYQSTLKNIESFGLSKVLNSVMIKQAEVLLYSVKFFIIIEIKISVRVEHPHSAHHFVRRSPHCVKVEEVRSLASGQVLYVSQLWCKYSISNLLVQRDIISFVSVLIAVDIKRHIDIDPFFDAILFVIYFFRLCLSIILSVPGRLEFELQAQNIFTLYSLKKGRIM